MTLITGDRVSLGPADQVRIEPGAGREKMRFATETVDGDVHVVPADAVPLVVAGRLDRRLFNVTKLVEARYDDRSRPDLPLIVEYAEGQTRTPGALGAGGARAAQTLPSVHGAAVVSQKRSTATFWGNLRGGSRTATSRFARGVERVWLDGPVRAALDHSAPQVGAPAAWQAGYTGAGVTVAVLDSGIDVTHPDLADAVVAAQDFSGSDTGPDDKVGHGTHVASIVTGSGAASAGRYRGVAPDAVLMNGKVIGDHGFGTESAVIAGMEWAATNGADVVNMSLGFDVFTDEKHPTARALDELTERTGALFVVAAGNAGPVEHVSLQATATDAEGNRVEQTIIRAYGLR